MTDQEKWRKYQELRQQRAEITTDILKVTSRAKMWLVEAERFLRDLKHEERALYRHLKF